MTEAETQLRRETFWELYTYDSWQVRRFANVLCLIVALTLP